MKVRGTVKWFNAQKGYGFIQKDNGGDIFVHHSSINQQGYRSLAEGEKVEFEEVPSDKGMRAANVTKVAA